MGEHTSQQDAFAAICQSWQKWLCGDGAQSAATRLYLQRLNDRAGAWWRALLPPGSPEGLLWADLDLRPHSGDGMPARLASGRLHQAAQRLLVLAKAWATPGGGLYGRPRLAQDVLAALERFYRRCYNENEDSAPFYGNWWHWEIGIPQDFLQAALLLRGHLSTDALARYAAAAGRFTPVCDRPSGYPGSPEMTGANLVDKAMVVLLRGALTADAHCLDHVHAALHPVFRYVQSGDGFYADGSFIQHQALAYTGGYGKDLYEKLGVFFTVLAGTSWRLRYADHAEQLLFEMLEKGILPFFYRGRFLDMVAGRSIARRGMDDRLRGALMLSAVLPVAAVDPDATRRARVQARLRGELAADFEYFCGAAPSITAVALAGRLLEEDPAPAPPPPDGLRVFPGMDKTVYTRPRFSAGLSLCSSRTYGHELINDEGKQTWNVSEGMLYLYTGDGAQFDGGYWPTVDPTRLPGTTAEHVLHPAGAQDRCLNVSPQVGGCTLGGCGSACMQTRALGTQGQRNGALARKSWFFTGDEIVCVGSGITSATGQPVETVIENRRLPPGQTSLLLYNGQALDAGEKTLQMDAQAGAWLHLEQPGTRLGVYLAAPARLCAKRETRTGDWLSQGSAQGAEQNAFTTLWLAHGANPDNAGYAYVLLVGASAADTARWAKKPPLQLLCGGGVHGMARPGDGLTLLNFWRADEAAGFAADAPCCLALRRLGDRLHLAVSDPARQERVITLRLPFRVGGAGQDTGRLCVEHYKTETLLRFNSAGLMGQTLRAEL